MHPKKLFRTCCSNLWKCYVSIQKYLQRSVLLTAYCLPRMEYHTLLAIFLAPLYILINILYRPLDDFVDGCLHSFSRPLRSGHALQVFIFFLSTSLLTCFLIRKPPALRFWKIRQIIFQGTFLYILIVIVTTEIWRSGFTSSFESVERKAFAVHRRCHLLRSLV